MSNEKTSPIIRNIAIVILFIIFMLIYIVSLEVSGNGELAERIGFIFLAPSPLWVVLAIVAGILEIEYKS